MMVFVVDQFKSYSIVEEREGIVVRSEEGSDGFVVVGDNLIRGTQVAEVILEKASRFIQFNSKGIEELPV